MTTPKGTRFRVHEHVRATSGREGKVRDESMIRVDLEQELTTLEVGNQSNAKVLPSRYRLCDCKSAIHSFTKTLDRVLFTFPEAR